MSAHSNHITVLYFAQTAEITAKRQEQWPLTASTSVSEWLNEVVAKYPALAPLEERLKVAINQYHVNHEATIQPGDEVALFEPVTGG